MVAILLDILKKYWLYLILLGIIGSMGIAYKIKASELTTANIRITALNTTVVNLNGQIANEANAIAIQNNAINLLKSASDAKQAQLDALGKSLQDLTVKQAATVKALEAATAPQTDAATITYLQNTLQGVQAWSNTLNTLQ